MVERRSLESRNKRLEEQLEANPIDKAIASLTKADKHRRRQIILLTVSLVFDLLLSVALAFGWQQNHNLAIRAESNKDAIIHNCETSNEARVNNKRLWQYILDIPPTTPRTAEQEARVQEFRDFVNKTFQVRDCTSL